VTTSADLRLVDEPDRSGRSTATLLASLSGRLAALHGITGADAVGSLTAGYAALGRSVARTAEGGRMLAAIRSSRAGANGERLWEALLIGKWASSLPPAPILDHLRNDLALLLADDVDETLDLPSMPPEPVGAGGGPVDETATAEHYLLGMWAFAREVQASVEELASEHLPPPGRVVTAIADPPLDGPVLP
jgi:hypothetical protein